MRSSAVFLLDRISTGMAEKVRTAFNTVKPSIPGRFTARTMRSNAFCCRDRLRAVSPSPASVTS